MANYTIKPDSGHPYINIQMAATHPEIGKPSLAQRGEVLLNVLHNNGQRHPLSFFKHEIEEVK